MNSRHVNLMPLLHPVPIVLIGVKRPGFSKSANFTTIGDIAIAGLNPPLLMVSLHDHHLSREGIDHHQKFSVHIPDESMIHNVDYCGMVSGHHVDKSVLFDVDWIDDTIPIIRNMPIILLCETERRIQIEQRVIYIVRVTDWVLRKDVNPEDLSFTKTLLYGLDNHYYRVGERIGMGYHEGRSIEKATTTSTINDHD